MNNEKFEGGADLMKWLQSVLKKNAYSTSPIPDLTPEQAETNEVATEVPDLVTSSGKNALEGLLIFYVNVGQLPAFHVDKYLKRMQESYKKALDRVPEKYAVLFVPRRPNGGNDSTTVELVRF